MKHGLKNVFGFVAGTVLALGAGTAGADAVGPYYATPSWDQTLPASTRFVVLSNFNSQAVLDRETGLVWEKSPSNGLELEFPEWGQIQFLCATLSKGNRKGWRLPTLQELASLVDGDPANTGSPRLPPGHPFQNVRSSMSDYYWSATSEVAPNTDAAYIVSFFDGSVNGAKKDFFAFAWCVRGGQGVDPQ